VRRYRRDAAGEIAWHTRRERGRALICDAVQGGAVRHRLGLIVADASPLVTLAAGAALMVTGIDRLAEFERELIRARTTEGGRRAVARGAKLGRRPKLIPHRMKEAIKRRDRGEETLRAIARSHKVRATARFRG
jgi:DNA invertase Pin-like site-specific DNA recombinase